MPTTYKVLGQSAPANTSNADLYTVGAGKSAVISTISITNDTNATSTGRVFIRVAGAAAGLTNALVYDTTFAANSTTALTFGITLAATDVITVQTGVANALTFMAFGSEIS
jgi:uncharacterized membrane protein YgaE (UPF0421/DUF939 family)